jgi:uncharacterized protein involved in exopolysaccharide biosynthesis
VDTPDTSFDLREALAVLRRRRLPISLIALVLAAVAVVVAVVWPPSYRSSATILVEEQEIPQDLVRSTVTSYADERIQVIGQQVMTRQNLLQIVDKYDLYPGDRRVDTNEEILAQMRKHIKIDLVSANAAGGRRVTIAFTLAYDGETPVKAQRVANELVTLYLNENLKLRQQKAEETAVFLGGEASRLEARMLEIEAQLAAFKRRNANQLPELAPLNMQLRDRIEAEIPEIERTLRLMELQRSYLQSQLAQTDREPEAENEPGADRVPTPAERLRELKSQYAGLRGVYAEEHPDMVRMRQQMESLEREVAAGGGSTTTAGDSETRRLAEQLEAELTALRESYSADHPDVVRLQQRLAALRAEEAAAAAPTPTGSDRINRDYLALESQIRVLDSEMTALRTKRVDLEKRLAVYEARLVQTPQVEQEYLDLTRERENTLARYREMKGKQMEAQVAQELEKERKGERFSLIDPPQLPEEPRSPNRPVILVLGLVAALGGGVGYGSVLEALDRSIKSPRQLARVFPAPLLSVIPHIETAAERRRRLRNRWLLTAGIAVAVITALVLVHLFYRPLGVLWFALLRRFDLQW